MYEPRSRSSLFSKLAFIVRIKNEAFQHSIRNHVIFIATYRFREWRYPTVFLVFKTLSTNQEMSYSNFVSGLNVACVPYFLLNGGSGVIRSCLQSVTAYSSIFYKFYSTFYQYLVQYYTYSWFKLLQVNVSTYIWFYFTLKINSVK